MDSFRWNEYFMTALPDVDRQHQHLVEIINRFGRHIAENEIEPMVIEDIFKELASYARYHFQDEEEMMHRVRVDPRHLNQHVEEHEGFLQDVFLLYSDISPDDPDTVKYLMDFLTHWLAYHILGSDQNMARQIQLIEEGAAPNAAYETGERPHDKATEALLIALDGLFRQVTERNKELARLNQVLEEKVEERTRELSEANRHLEELSLTDVLTGLPNRRHAMRQLENLWSESLQQELPLVCMMIDADHFKEVNDTYGHDAGDQVLQILAQTLKDNIRTDDVVCRLGGDEFFILCPNTGESDGVRVAEAVRQEVSALRVSTGDGVWHGSISVGVAARTKEMEHGEDLIQRADKGVYAAKRDGKNCVRTADA